MDWLDIVQKAVIFFLSVVTARNARREWKVKKRLGSNPTRCEDMAKRMKVVEEKIIIMNDDIKYILKRME